MSACLARARANWASTSVSSGSRAKAASCAWLMFGLLGGRRGPSRRCRARRVCASCATRGVQINGVNAARIGCVACKIAGARLVTGAATVHINGEPAPRFHELSTEKGKIIFGSPNVLIGGPGAGGGLVTQTLRRGPVKQPRLVAQAN